MTDYGYVFSTNLHAKLKEKVVGKVFVRLNYNDELYIKIESFGGLKYETRFVNFSERLVNGVSTDYIAYQVIEGYKQTIITKYLK